MKKNLVAALLWAPLMLLVIDLINAQNPPNSNPFPVGTNVEVKWSGVWYPAKVKEVRGQDLWFISYDGYSASWDEEVGRDRIRSRGLSNQLKNGSNTESTKKEDETFIWPTKPANAKTPIEGAYFELVMYTYPYTSYSYVSWFFTKDGRFSQTPSGGINLRELSNRVKANKYEGVYWIEGNQLVMVWADGRKPWRLSNFKGLQVLPIGAGATRQSPFPRGWRFDGSYEGGASAGGGTISSSNTLHFKRDGTYTRGSVISVSSTGRNTEVSGGASGSAAGTYQFDEYTLTLRENGTEKKYTVFSYGTRDAAGRPEQIFWEGGLIKRQNN